MDKFELLAFLSAAAPKYDLSCFFFPLRFRSEALALSDCAPSFSCSMVFSAA